MAESHKCKYPGCNEDALIYVNSTTGSVRHQKYCRFHHNEANKLYASSRPAKCKVCGKKGTKATIIRGRCSECADKKISYKEDEQRFLAFARNYNKENPLKIDRDILCRGFNDLSRIPSGGKCNHATIEGE